MTRFILQNKTRVRFEGWTMNSWHISDSPSKCLAVHECPTSMSYRISIWIVVHHFLWRRSLWGLLRCCRRSQTAAAAARCLYKSVEINGKSKGIDAEEVANMMIYIVAKCGWDALGLFFIWQQFEVWRGAVSHCQFVAVSEATGERRPVSQEGLTQGGRDISSLSTPKGEFITSENYKSSQENRHRCESCIFHCRESWSCCWVGNC